MDITHIMQRVKDLENAVLQSLSNHNGLLGRLAEAQDLLQMMHKGLEVAEEVIEVAEEVL